MKNEFLLEEFDKLSMQLMKAQSSPKFYGTMEQCESIVNVVQENIVRLKTADYSDDIVTIKNARFLLVLKPLIAVANSNDSFTVEPFLYFDIRHFNGYDVISSKCVARTLDDVKAFIDSPEYAQFS